MKKYFPTLGKARLKQLAGSALPGANGTASSSGTDRITIITVINLVIRFLGGSSRPFCKSILKQFLITLQVFVGSGIFLVPMTSLSLSFAAFQDLFYIVAKGLFLSLFKPSISNVC